MIAIALNGLEAALNKVLRLDPKTIEKCKQLDGTCIKIEITDWNLYFFILPYAHGLQLATDFHKKPDTTISGKLFNLMKVGATGATTASMFDASITISGDTKTGEAIRNILQSLDIDWEEQLSKVVGDRLAHPIIHQFKKLLRFGKHSIKSFGENISEYLHYESKQLPPKRSVEQFIQDVGRLRDDIDRTEARIQRLSTRKKES